jgi:hypothetical protein
MREYELDPSSTNSSLAVLLIRQKIRIVLARSVFICLLTGTGPYEKSLSTVNSPVFACSILDAFPIDGALNGASAEKSAATTQSRSGAVVRLNDNS